jgi:HTH-type transcriptional regulator / antitoxin HigA
MAEQSRNEYEPSDVSPPGATLRELLEDRGLTQSDLATRMGRPQKTISEIVNGKAAITPETALELELVLSVPASFWNARERDYRAFLARRDQQERLALQLEWLSNFPVAGLAKAGWIERYRDKKRQLKELLQFFGVASPAQWHNVFSACEVAFRQSESFSSDRHALSAWLRCGILIAERAHCATYDKGRFVDALDQIRELTQEPAGVFVPAMTELSAEAGVVVAFVPQIPKARLSGATRWLNADKALIQLSLRYKTDDQLWFTFFHEAAHIVLHGKRLIFLDTGECEGDLEDEANRWAADVLIPRGEYEEFAALTTHSQNRIRSFARSIGIAPGIVVGRLQHDGILPHSFCNDLKRRLEWVQQSSPAA